MNDNEKKERKVKSHPTFYLRLDSRTFFLPFTLDHHHHSFTFLLGMLIIIIRPYSIHTAPPPTSMSRVTQKFLTPPPPSPQSTVNEKRGRCHPPYLVEHILTCYLATTHTYPHQSSHPLCEFVYFCIHTHTHALSLSHPWSIDLCV